MAGTLNIAIVGAGVIGTTTALALQRDGHRVTLFDRAEAGRGASYGNAGVIVNGSCVPTAMPGAAASGIRMLFDPLAPVTIRTKYALRAAPWLRQFLRQSSADNAIRNARHLLQLTQSAIADWQRLTGNSSWSKLMHQCGWLKVYTSDASFDSTARSRQLMDDLGSPYRVLDRAEVRELEPNLASDFIYGILQEGSLRISDPHRLVREVFDLFCAGGGSFQSADVDRITAAPDSAALHHSGLADVYDHVVVAAGAHSKKFANAMGDSVPLDTERGYHLMISDNSSGLLQRPVMHGERQFVLAPMDTGVRLTGGVELAGIDAQPDYRYIRRMLPHARKMLPALRGSEASVWMGCRPSLPDSLPVLGYSRKSQRVLYAFGHQHLGMTLAAGTAQIMADLIAKRIPHIDMHPYSAARFSAQ